MHGYEPKNPILRQKSLNGNFQYAIWTLIPFHNPYSVR
jgi:hypothetical protein